MTLRRFPWKQPRITDNSYKLFASPPTPGTPVPGGHHSVSAPNLANNEKEGNHSEKPTPDEKPQPHPVPAESDTKVSEQAEHKEHAPSSTSATNNTSSTSTSTSTSKPSDSIKGPWRLLRLLPRESRHIIGMMLKINPRERATLRDVLQDEWVATSPVCMQDETGQVIKAGTHKHTLEPGAAVSTVTPAKKA